MKKNLYYRSSFKRVNVFKTLLLSVFNSFRGSARMTIEVFTRKNFGERYFLLSSALWLALIFALLPVVIVKFMSASVDMPMQDFNYDTMEPTTQAVQSAATGSLMPDYLTWYIFIAVFLGVSFKHHLDMQRNPSVFDFARMSAASGDFKDFIFKIKLPFLENNPRNIECFIEPLIFFVMGAVLWLIGQNLGVLFVVASILYCINYLDDYMHGDHFIMDRIDEMIVNEEMEKAFVHDAPETETRGFRMRSRKPNTEEMRRRILPLMTENEEILTVE